MRVEFVVVIATSGRPKLLRKTLASLGECALPEGYRETVVVENGAKGNVEEIVRGAPQKLRTRYMYVAEGNQSGALNAARATLGECFIFFTDDDVRPEPGVLCAYADAAERNGPGHFFGGPTAVEYEAAPPAWLIPYFPPSARGWEWNGNGHHVDVPEFLGFNWGAWASDIRAAGGFDSNRGPGAKSGSTGYESDMQRRLLQRGLKGIYLPEARVWHYVPKERCSEQWAIQRNFRIGVQEGIVAIQSGAGGAIARWPARRKILTGIMRTMLRSIAGNHEQKFLAKYCLNFDRGFLKGMGEMMNNMK